MTNEEFYDWRISLGWSRARVAKELGISPATVQLYERGARFDRDMDQVPVPRAIELACRYISKLANTPFPQKPPG